MSELNWLPLSVRKGIHLPKVELIKYTGQNYGGFYDSTKNLIHVVVNYEEDVPATIAHEFAHHIQYVTNSRKRGNSSKSLELFNKYSYEKAINLYFNTYWHEYEALEFQEKYAPSDLGDWWLNKLVKDAFNHEV